MTEFCLVPRNYFERKFSLNKHSLERTADSIPVHERHYFYLHKKNKSKPILVKIWTQIVLTFFERMSAPLCTLEWHYYFRISTRSFKIATAEFELTSSTIVIKYNKKYCAMLCQICQPTPTHWTSLRMTGILQFWHRFNCKVFVGMAKWKFTITKLRKSAKLIKLYNFTMCFF